MINSVDKLKNNVMQDEIFKDIVRYKGIASLIIKLTIEEYSNMSLIDIAKLIVDRRQRGLLKDDEVFEDEIDMLPTEIGTGAEKNTINDIVFLVKSPSSKSYNKVTVNIEMQTTRSYAYNMISRGIYYGASLLRDTVPAGDTNYTNIHKVYSIWLCAKNLNISVVEEIKDKYIHK